MKKPPYRRHLAPRPPGEPEPIMVPVKRFEFRYPSASDYTIELHVRFPKLCACCGAKEVPFVAIAQHPHFFGRRSKRTFVPVSVPYCETCAAHVGPRLAEARSPVAPVIFFVVATLVAFGAFSLASANVLPAFVPFLCLIAIPIGAAIVNASQRSDHKGPPLPQTPSCTIPVLFHDVQTTKHIFEATDVNLTMDVANAAFAAEVSARNKQLPHSTMKVTEADAEVPCSRSPRGDLFVEAIELVPS